MNRVQSRERAREVTHDRTRGKLPKTQLTVNLLHPGKRHHGRHEGDKGRDDADLQGEGFAPKVLEKIRDLRAKNPEIEISVDGGVNIENAKEILEAGATRLVSGSLIFNTEDKKEVIEELKNL